MSQITKRPDRGKSIYLLPSAFTTAGLFAGFFAIVQATKGNFDNAAIGILIATVMDGLDGRIARWTNTSSDFGKEYDSLVDVISFGLTPALVMYEWVLYAGGKLGWLAAFVYVAATALRLARFNTVEVVDKRYFQGLACPAAAGFIAATVWLLDTTPSITGRSIIFGVVVTAGLALLMVSSVPYRSFKELDQTGNVSLPHAFFLVVILAIIFWNPPRVLFTGLLIYLLSGPVLWVVGYFRNPGETRHETTVSSEASKPESHDPPQS